MTKAKILTVFVAIVAALTVSVTPAYAEFESTTGKATGLAKSGPVVLEGGGATLECTSTEDTWTILSGGKEALKGNTSDWSINQWNGCKAKTSEIKEVAPVATKCVIRLTVTFGGGTIKASIVIECWFKFKILSFTCTIHISLGKEAEGINFGLEKNSAENSGSNLIVKAEDTGITTTTTGTCPGVKGTKEAKLKTTFTGEGLKTV